MGDDLAASNVNRSYSLGTTSIAIFTFMLFFLYPRFASGEINALLFQATLVVMGVATFSFVFASLYYYWSALGSRIGAVERALYSQRGDRFWLLGYTAISRSYPDPLFDWASCRRICVVGTLAGLLALRNSLLSADPDRAKEMSAHQGGLTDRAEKGGQIREF